MKSPLTGAWELVSDGQQGFMVFTDEHFNIYVDPLDRPTLDAADAYASQWAPTVRGTGGTYSVDGSTAALHYTATPATDSPDTDLSVEYEMSGDELRFRGTQPDGSVTPQSTWRRVA